MTPPDKHDSDLGGGRQKRRRNSATRDTTNGQDDKPVSPRDSGDRPNRQPNESSYAAASQRDARAEVEAFNVRVEFVIVPSGTPEAQELLMQQAMAVRRVLQWFAEHPAPTEGHRT